MNELVKESVYIASAIIGLAILAVLLSKNAQTVQVANAFGTIFENSLKIAVSPISGQGSIGGLSALPSLNAQ